MLSRKNNRYNKSIEKKEPRKDATRSDTSATDANSSSSEMKRINRNLHVSTSLPGPLAGYRRKRTQAVQAGDDSEFYKTVAESAKLLRKNNGPPPDDDILYGDSDDDEEMAEYDETTLRHNLPSVNSISQQTSPIRVPPLPATTEKLGATTPSQKVIGSNNSNDVGCGSENCIMRTKCHCDPVRRDEIIISDSQTQTGSRSPSNQATPLLTAKSTPMRSIDNTPAHFEQAEPLLAKQRQAPLDEAMNKEAEVGDEEVGGFAQAIKSALDDHFNQQKLGDVENVVAKFATETNLEKNVDSPQPPVAEREQWDSKIDFLLSVVGFAVDLSAVWRFPAVCFSNGGGAFLVPYIIMILLCGLPLMYMEFCLGQFHRNGCITIWTTICPMFKGVGFAICVITSIIAMYYNTIMAWSLYILFSSISTTVPWESCNNPWNSNDSCVTFEERTRLTKHVQDIIRNCTLAFNATAPALGGESFIVQPSEGSPSSGSGYAVTTHGPDYSQSDGVTGFDRETICNISATSGTTKFVFQNQISSAEEYFYNGVLELNRSHGFTDLGPIKWQIAACLFLIFTVVYFALWKGVKSSGKAVWFTATFPYVVLFILLCRVMTLPGSWTGVQYYITPNLEYLYHFRVWQEAAGQVLFQLGPGFGVLLALSSYNKFHNNCLTDAIITTAISSFTSIMAGFVVFGTLGYIAGMLDKSIDQLEAFGHGLTFVAYPEAISTLPGAPIWAVLFFAMLINLGLDTTFGGLESMITGLVDYLPVKVYKRREYFVLAIIAYIYFGALPTCTYGGILLAQFYDSYGVEIPLLLIAFLECVGVCYVYGIPHFSRDIAMMHGHEPAAFWKFCWCFISPFVVLFSFAAACFREKDTHYRNIAYPHWAGTLGWALTFFSISCVPTYAIYLFVSTKGSMQDRFIALIGKDAWILTVMRERRLQQQQQQQQQNNFNANNKENHHTEEKNCNEKTTSDDKNNTRTTGAVMPPKKDNVQKQAAAESSAQGAPEKLVTIIDMHYCDIDSPSTGNSPFTEQSKVIV